MIAEAEKSGDLASDLADKLNKIIKDFKTHWGKEA